MPSMIPARPHHLSQIVNQGITVVHKIFSNLSQRAAEMLKEDMEVMGPVKVRDVELAQQNIIKTARRLEEEGKIVLGGKGGDDVIV